ncbi:MAG: glycosyltransferase family 2 protein [Sedimentibacter sp.]|nr:glycosyltransferase family 2 protein [Sedimentibacter sp.]
MEKVNLKVSVIIPCRNEKNFIGKCLDSIIAQDYPKDSLEVLVVDGMSEDRTREVIKDYVLKNPYIKLLDNPKRIVPTALNIAIKNAKGAIIIRMDAHNIYEKDYLSNCVTYLTKHNVDNVGGIWITLPGNETLIAKSIALALSHPFGVGNAYFRIGSKEPKYVDTVPFGCYKKEVFEKIGLFDEDLVRNQDIEFNLRLKKAGGRILLVPDIVSYYHARSTLRSLAKNNFLNGLWVIYSIKFAKMPFSLRHLIPFFFVTSLLGSLILSLFYHPFIYLFTFIITLYLIINIFFSIKLSIKNGLKYFPFLISSFFALHFSYGLGSIWGFLKLLMPEKRYVK